MRGTTTRPRDVLAPAFAPLPPKRELKTHYGGGGLNVNGTSDGPGAVARRRRCHVEANGPRGAVKGIKPSLYTKEVDIYTALTNRRGSSNTKL
jgi:hypothetical protein